MEPIDGPESFSIVQKNLWLGSRVRGPRHALLSMTVWKVTVTISADTAEFTSFIEDIGRPLRQALIAAYGPQIGAEVTAEALAYAWEHWSRISAMKNPAGYLYRVGQTQARRGIFRKPPPFESPVFTQPSEWYEPGLAPAIATLSDKQRAAVILVHGFGWSITEVAEMWGVTFSTVRAHVDRGLRRLRKKLGVAE